MSETINDDDDSETVNGIRVSINDERLDPNAEAAERAAAAYDETPTALSRIAPAVTHGQSVLWLDMHDVESNTATRLYDCVPAGYEIIQTSIIGAYREEDPAISLAVTVEPASEQPAGEE